MGSVPVIVDVVAIVLTAIVAIRNVVAITVIISPDVTVMSVNIVVSLLKISFHSS